MPTFTITIRDTQTGLVFESRHRGEDAWEAVDKSVKKRWGKKSSFCRNDGAVIGESPLDRGQYGRVVEPSETKPGTNIPVTGQMYVEAYVYVSKRASLAG